VQRVTDFYHADGIVMVLVSVVDGVQDGVGVEGIAMVLVLV